MPADYKPHLKERANELFQDKWFKITYGTRVLGFILEADEACSNYIDQCETEISANNTKADKRVVNSNVRMPE